MDKKSSMKTTDLIEWVPTSLCNNPRHSSLKESVPDLNDLIIIREVIYFN